MFECTYTTQKTKKSKKWIDGYVAVKDKRLVIYDESRKAIHSTTSYRIEDDLIDTPTYLVYTDSLDLVLEGRTGKTEKIIEKLDDKVTDEVDVEFDVSVGSTAASNSAAKGRSDDEILSLFRSK